MTWILSGIKRIKQKTANVFVWAFRRRWGRVRFWKATLVCTPLGFKWCHSTLFWDVSKLDGVKKGKKRKIDDAIDDGTGPPNKKARPAPKITKGRFKGQYEASS